MASEDTITHTDMSHHPHKSLIWQTRETSACKIVSHYSSLPIKLWDSLQALMLSEQGPCPAGLTDLCVGHCTALSQHSQGKFLSWLCLQSSFFWPLLWSFGSCSTQLPQPDELFDLLFVWVGLTTLLINFLPPDSSMHTPAGTLPGPPPTLADSPLRPPW